MKHWYISSSHLFQYISIFKLSLTLNDRLVIKGFPGDDKFYLSSDSPLGENTQK